MTVYYVKQDNTVWGCGDAGCCGEYYEEIDEKFHECNCEQVEVDIEPDMADHLQTCMGGGPILKWRKAKRLEVQAWVEGKDSGFNDGCTWGIEWQKNKEKYK